MTGPVRPRSRACYVGDPKGTSSGPGRAPRRTVEVMRRRERRYLVMMGICVTLFVASWAFVRLYSTVAAIVMSAIAMCIPPGAAIVGNARDTDDEQDEGDTWRSPRG